MQSLKWVEIYRLAWKFKLGLNQFIYWVENLYFGFKNINLDKNLSISLNNFNLGQFIDVFKIWMVWIWNNKSILYTFQGLSGVCHPSNLKYLLYLKFSPLQEWNPWNHFPICIASEIYIQSEVSCDPSDSIHKPSAASPASRLERSNLFIASTRARQAQLSQDHRYHHLLSLSVQIIGLLRFIL